MIFGFSIRFLVICCVALAVGVNVGVIPWDKELPGEGTPSEIELGDQTGEPAGEPPHEPPDEPVGGGV